MGFFGDTLLAVSHLAGGTNQRADPCRLFFQFGYEVVIDGDIAGRLAATFS